MLGKKQPQAAFLALFDCTADDLQSSLEELQLPVALDARWNRGPEKTRWSIPHTRQFALAWCEGARVQPLAEQFGRKPGSLYAKARQMGLPKRRRSRLHDRPLPLFDFAAVPVEPAPAIDRAPVPVPALLDWSDLVGVSDQQPEQLLLPDLEPDPEPEPVLEQPADPEPERVLPALRKLSIPVPDACRGFAGPQTREEFDRFCKLMVDNTLGSIRRHLGGLDASSRQDAVQVVYLALLEWFVGESPKFPGRPRYLNYDPSKNLEFWQWYIRQIPYKTGEFWKGVKRVRDSGVNLTTRDTDEEMDALLEGDATAAMAMRTASVSAEDAIDMEGFFRTAQRISEHHAGTLAARFRAAASFSALINGIRMGHPPEEVHSNLQESSGSVPVTPHDLKSWKSELFRAAKMFQARGAQGILQHYGVPA